MRLIDADAFRKVIHCEYSDDLGILEKIDQAPTIKTFTLEDIEAQYRKGMKKGMEEAIPQGEWIRDFNMDKAPVCSECGEEAWYKEYRGWVTKSNFCPNCGADMRPKEGEAD